MVQAQASASAGQRSIDRLQTPEIAYGDNCLTWNDWRPMKNEKQSLMPREGIKAYRPNPSLRAYMGPV